MSWLSLVVVSYNQLSASTRSQQARYVPYITVRCEYTQATECSQEVGSISGSGDSDLSVSSCSHLGEDYALTGCSSQTIDGTSSSRGSCSKSTSTSGGCLPGAENSMQLEYCVAENSGTSLGIVSQASCCGGDGSTSGSSLDCRSVWSDDKSNSSVSVDCLDGYETFGCNGYSSLGGIREVFVDGNGVCRVSLMEGLSQYAECLFLLCDFGCRACARQQQKDVKMRLLPDFVDAWIVFPHVCEGPTRSICATHFSSKPKLLNTRLS